MKKGRRRYSEIFLDMLREWSGGERRLFGNKTLRAHLKWPQERYENIKWQLLNQGLLITGRGKGGSVGLANITPQSKALTVFIAYSHVDEQLKNELVKHLEPLKRLGLIETWHDQKLKPGDDWDKSISKNIEKADIILLLISIDFINSKYCYDVEMVQALALHNAGQTVVIPVIARACLWQDSPVGKIQAVPKDGKAISSWPDRDEALTNVVQLIRQTADHILAGR